MSVYHIIYFMIAALFMVLTLAEGAHKQLHWVNRIAGLMASLFWPVLIGAVIVLRIIEERRGADAPLSYRSKQSGF